MMGMPSKDYSLIKVKPMFNMHHSSDTANAITSNKINRDRDSSNSPLTGNSQDDQFDPKWTS